MNLYLDDLRVPSMSNSDGRGLGSAYSPTNKWTIVRDYFEFVDVIKNNFDEINLVSFDHDLACYKDGKEYTGKDAANFLIDYCLDNDKKFPNWFVHSDNTAGKSNIIGVILNYLNRIEGVDTSKFRYHHNGIINGLAV
jgi:hypothetical protein